MPTTAGTGSEVGRAGVITNEATHTKKVIFHPKLLPAIVICRSGTVGRHAAASSPPAPAWMRFAHCLEAYCAPGYHPMADGIAVEGIRLVFENLPKAYANGKDLVARAHMMSAAAMGATAFQKGLGAIHSLSHPVGALYDTHHGMTNAVFMPYVLAFNRDAIEERIARLAAYCGIKGGFDGFAKAIIKLRKELEGAARAAGPDQGARHGQEAQGADRRHGGGRSDRRRQPGQADQEGGADAARKRHRRHRSEALWRRKLI